jgi:hypothetical protein
MVTPMTADLAVVRTRWAAIGAAVAVTVGAAGVGGYSLVNADVSTGDRPVFVPTTPCRLADTRTAPNTVGPKSSPLGVAEIATITAHGSNGECTGAAAIPSDAVALALNVTALGATEQTFLTFWGDGDNPGTANLNPAPGQPPIPNAVNTPLSDAGTFNVFNEKGNVNIVIDVNGYYAHHDHDDRYEKTPDQVVLSGFEFQSDDPSGDEWHVDETFIHTPSATRECVYAPIDLPAGRPITGGTVNYITDDPGDFDVYLVGTVDRAGTYATEPELIDVAVDQTLSLPATPDADLVVSGESFDAVDDVVVRDDFTYVVTICTAIRVALVSVSFDTPEI